MISIKEKFSLSLDTKKGFGNLVDVFQQIGFFQVIYCIMLTINYNGYLNYENKFQPIAYFSIILLVMFTFLCEKLFVEIWKVAVCEIIMTILLVVLIPITGTKIYFIIGCLLICAKSIMKYRYRFSKEATYGERYRSINKTWIQTTVIIAALAIHMLSTYEKPEMISPKVCEIFLLASLEIFVISNIMTKFAFKFYEYYRQEKNEAGQIHKNIKHAFLLIFIFAVLLITAAFIVFGNVFVYIVEFIITIILKLLGAVLLQLFNIDLTSDIKLNQTQASNKFASSDIAALQNKNVRSDSVIGEIVPYIVMFIVGAALVYLIWKIYKKILANYKIESDEVEFVPINEIKTDYDSSKNKIQKMIFGKSNREKIRSYYYNTVSRKKKKHDIIINSSKTPTEINNIIGQYEKEKNVLSDMTKMYEKARYANDDIKPEEVELMKKWSDNIN